MNQPSFQIEDQGLFTFYMHSTNQQTFDHFNSYEVEELLKSNQISNRRKNSNIFDNDRKQSPEKLSQQFEIHRQQKLNKFLVNCIGAGRRIKNIEHSNLKINDTINHQKQQNSTEKQYSNQIIKKLQQSKDLLESNSKNQYNIPNITYHAINKQNKNEIKLDNQSKLKNQTQKPQNLNEKNYKATRSISKQSNKKKQNKQSNYFQIQTLNIEDAHSKSASTEKKVYKEKNSRTNSRKKQQKIKLSLDGHKVLNEKNSQLSQKENLVGQYRQVLAEDRKLRKQKQLKLVNDFYPRLAKHNSQKTKLQTCIHDSINIASIFAQNIKNYNLNQHHQNVYHNLMQQLCNERRNYQKKMNTQKYGIKCIRKQNQPKLRIKSKNRNKRTSEQKQKQLPDIYSKIALAKTTPISSEMPKNIYMHDVCSQIYKSHQKRKNRLLFIYKNSKSSLPPLKLPCQNIQQQSKINQIYYSTDHKQKKVTEINMGMPVNDRIIEGWQQRKKNLLQKINSTEKSSKKSSKNKADKKDTHIQITQNNKQLLNKHSKQNMKLYLSSASRNQPQHETQKIRLANIRC